MSKKTHSADLRVRRTRQLLHEAFQDLATEKRLAAITVQDVTRRAGLNRGTFYLHYKDKDDLLSSIFEEAIDRVREESERYFTRSEALSLEDTPPFLLGFFTAIQKRKAFYRQLLRYEGERSFRTPLFAYLKESILYALPEALPSPKLEGVPDSLLAHYFAATITELLAWWLAQDDNVPAEDIARWCWEVIALTLRVPQPFE